MASPVVGPPMPPPETSGQMGGSNPFAGIGALLQGRMGDQQPDGSPGNQPPQSGGADPMGAIMAQKNALEKVLQQMAQQLPGFGPYGDRAMQMITAGIEAGAKAKSQPSSAAPESSGGPTMVSPLGGGTA
jgi:hypothetical protein